MEYLAVIEQDPEGGWGAYIPDLPGCAAVGDTQEEAIALIRDALPLHVQGQLEDDQEVPPPRAFAVHIRL